MTTFIGVDLAWRSDRNHSGIAVLQGDSASASLVAVGDSIRDLSQVAQFISAHLSTDAVVAIDAPLVIANETGQRPCETAVGSRYGARDASCHTSNLRLYPDASSVTLARTLVQRGFRHAPESIGVERVMLEVYPHAAMVALFDLPKVLKYKKGTVAQKRDGLESLAEHIRRLSCARPVLASTAPLERLLAKHLAQLSGPQLKMHEDVLDAVFCAYLAYYYWFWKWERNEVFGDLATGYIVNPRLLPGGVESHEA